MKRRAVKTFSRFINESSKDDLVDRILAAGDTFSMRDYEEHYEDGSDLSVEEIVSVLIEKTGATGIDDLLYVHSENAYDNYAGDLLDELNIVDRRSDSYAFSEDIGGHNWKVTSMEINGAIIPILIEHVMVGPGGFWAFYVSKSKLTNRFKTGETGPKNIIATQLEIALKKGEINQGQYDSVLDLLNMEGPSDDIIGYR